MNLLFFDTETGGLDPREHDLLSLGLVVSEAGKVKDALEILVRHEPYRVSAGGMRVNRIDLVKHHEKALAPQQAREALDAFCTRHFGPSAPLTLVGHNVHFDRDFLGAFLAKQHRALEPRYSHRLIDTHSVAAAMQAAGRLPEGLKLSSTALFDHFGIVVPEGQRHTALGDALATHDLYWRLVEAMR